jgi:hypothetical protein
MKNRLFIGLVLFAVLITAACCKKDPCANQTATSADFDMSQVYLNEYVPMINGDTLLEGANGVTIKFKATDSTAKEYKWKIGTDPRVFTQKEFKLDFGAFNTIDVTLIITKDIDPLCAGTDDGVDTIRKVFTVLPIEKSLAYGVYNGFLTDNPLDTFNFTLAYFPTEDFANYDNLPKGCFARQKSDHAVIMRYKGFFLGKDVPTKPNGSCIQAYNSLATLQNDYKTLEFTFKQWSDVQQKGIQKTFIGKKIR